MSVSHETTNDLHDGATVAFTAMEDGTKDDYVLVFAHEQEQIDTQADRVMDWLRLHADEGAKAILAINPGLPQQARAALGWAGFKGGSEQGVANLTWLVQTRSGAWYAVSAGWNNPAAPVDNNRLAGLGARVVQLLR